MNKQGNKTKQNLSRRIKRKWNGVVGNKKSSSSYILSSTMTSSTTQAASSCSSERKIKPNYSNTFDSGKDNYFVFINFSILKELIAKTACNNCFQPLLLTDVDPSRKGFAHLFQLKCEHCDYVKRFNSSNKSINAKFDAVTANSPYDVNIRAIIAFREVGCGYGAIKTFSSCMNLKCISENGFQKLNKTIMVAYKSASEKSMLLATKDSKKVDIAQDIPCVRVSIDGTWQKRGHNSLHGVVTAISGDKCIDIEVLSKYCMGCKMWNSKKGTPEYQCWIIDHQCEINHKSSSGSMESAGAVTIFNRSVKKNNLIYKEFLGDGDTSSFKDVKNSNPYQDFDITPIKLECVGHVQKRLGTRLRNLVKAHKGTKTPLSGRGNLTEKCINSMQNYYGMAIRQNVNNLYAMKKAVYAILFHFTNFENQQMQHQFCPRGLASRCKYWALNNTNYKSKSCIPIWIKNLILPIIKDLQADDLLIKCLHGTTQNANEALNSIIWSRVPKHTFVSKSTIEMGTYSAVLHYNDGANGVLEVLKYFGLSGIVTLASSSKVDKTRIRHMKSKSTDKSKMQRKKIRAVKKGFIDDQQIKETTDSYISGGF